MDACLPFGAEFAFFVAHYLAHVGVRELALIALITKAARRDVLRLVASFERPHLAVLAASVRPGTNRYWRIRYLAPATRPHLQYGTLVWSNATPHGLVRLRGFWNFSTAPSGKKGIKRPVAPCDAILLLSHPLACCVDVTNIEHYAVLAPALEVAVARLRLKEVQDAFIVHNTC